MGEPPTPLGGGLEPARQGHSRLETSDTCAQAGWERRFCSLCNCVAEKTTSFVLVFACHRGNCVGAGMGAGWQRAQFGIKGATSL